MTTANKPTLQERKQALARRIVAAINAFYHNGQPTGNDWYLLKQWGKDSEARLKRYVQRFEKAVSFVEKSKAAATEDESNFWRWVAQAVWITESGNGIYDFALQLYPQFKSLVQETGV